MQIEVENRVTVTLMFVWRKDNNVKVAWKLNDINNVIMSQFLFTLKLEVSNE